MMFKVMTLSSISGTPVDIDRYQYGYDQNSNRTYKGNSVAHAAGVYLDEAYSYDNLNRLTEMQRGNLSSGVITGTPTREMDYTLDPTGNWSAYLTKTSGTTDLNQTRTANKANELTAIGGTPAWATPPAYDAAGNMTRFPQPASPASNFIADYDAWNRLVSLSSSGKWVAAYQYDGRGRRIVKKTYAGSGFLLSTRHFYYSNQWQDLEERVDGSTEPNFQYVWGIRDVDELICRDYHNPSDSSSSSGGGGTPPPSRIYAMQDANFNLTGITDASGTVLERYVFDPYGNRTICSPSWTILSNSNYAWSIGHQGLMLDAESGLVYNRARYLSPALGHFINRDPAGYVDGADSYLYLKSSPVDNLDPIGSWSQKHPTVPCQCSKKNVYWNGGNETGTDLV